MAFVFIDPSRRKKRKVEKSEESQRVLAALDSYLEGNVDEPVRWLVRFWRDQGTAFTYRELLNIVTDEDDPYRRFNAWFQDYSKLFADKITPMWQEAFLAGANSNPLISGLGYQVDTSARNVREWIVNHGAELVTSASQEQVNAIRYIVAESQASKMSVQETARYIRPTIGLTERQAEANLKHYNAVKEQLQRDHPRMKQESIERKARKSAGRYAQQQQMYRAETIARTELAYAYNQGNDEAIRQMMDKGLLPIMRKVWSTAQDGHVCTACEDLEGEEIGMDDEFKVTVGKGTKRTLSVSVPPLHPRCKCALAYEETDQWKPKTDDQETIEVPEEGDDNQRDRQLHYEDESTFTTDSGTFTARRIKNFTENNIYIAEEVELKPREARRINRQVSQAKELLGLTDSCKAPVVIINSNRALASYNPVTDTFLISTQMANESDILRLQSIFTCPEDPRSTMVHELFHWKDADEYRKQFGSIIASHEKSEYSIFQREKAFDTIVEYRSRGIIGENLWQISRYAAEKGLANDYEEVYTEIRTYLAIRGGMI